MFKQIFVICVFALVTHETYSFHEDIERGNDSEDRTKRSLFAVGARASNTLLLNAKRMGKLGKQTLYVKQGGYQRAIDDLNSVKPTMVRDPRKYGKVQETVKGGIVGDRTITVIKGQKGEPTTLRITKRKDKSWTPKTVFPTIVIFYYE